MIRRKKEKAKNIAELLNYVNKKNYSRINEEEAKSIVEGLNDAVTNK